jgi:hypothetical protein
MTQEVDAVYALSFVNTVRRARSMPALQLLPLQGAVPGDPSKSVLARAMNCLVDNEMLQFPTRREATAVAAATGMQRVRPAAVRLPDHVAAIGVAFDQGLLNDDLIFDLQSARLEYLEAFARETDRIDRREILHFVNIVRLARGIELLQQISLAGVARGAAYVLSRELACVDVYEADLESHLVWLWMRFPDPDAAEAVARALPDEYWAYDCSVELPGFMARLYAAIELGTLDRNQSNGPAKPD